MSRPFSETAACKARSVREQSSLEVQHHGRATGSESVVEPVELPQCVDVVALETPSPTAAGSALGDLHQLTAAFEDPIDRRPETATPVRLATLTGTRPLTRSSSLSNTASAP